MTIINFGKYKGKDVKKLPVEYLHWLQNPIIREKGKADILFNVPETIKEESKKIIENIDYASKRNGGAVSTNTDYIIVGMGDLNFIHCFPSVEHALDWLQKTHEWIDPEDDRVLIWEVLSSGHKKVVWHFSGWHWSYDEFDGLEQGKYIGHERSVYEEMMED